MFKVGDRIKLGTAEGTVTRTYTDQCVVKFDDNRVPNNLLTSFLEKHAEIVVPPLKVGDKVKRGDWTYTILHIHGDEAFVEQSHPQVSQASEKTEIFRLSYLMGLERVRDS